LQIARLVVQRGQTEEQAILRIDAQPRQEEKAALADVVIVNDGDLAELREKVQAAWMQIQPSQPSQ
jgi:dephospho-CoA kinase